MRLAHSSSLSIPVSIVIVLMLASACTPAPETVHETRFMMGTLVDFTLYSDNKDNASIAIKAAADEMQRIEKLFTIYGDQPNSIKTFNTSAPDKNVTFPAEVEALLLQSEAANRESDGAFSITLGSLNRLWGFSLPAPPSVPPAAEQIEQLAALSRHCLAHQSPDGWSRSNKRCELDFGAIAKGYALEMGMKILKQHGIHDAIINAGGDIRVSGSRGERAWQIGLRHPRQAEQVMATLKIRGDSSIVTSGDYERFYLYQGQRYHHILDPETGEPADRAQSATVIAADATAADAWSTALFVMGRAGLEMVEKQGMDAILIAADGTVYTTKNIESRLQLTLSPPMLRTSN